jgi:hypothetical protein
MEEKVLRRTDCCGVCFAGYDYKDHLPKVLCPCGHALCGFCCKKLEDIDEEGHATCPQCLSRSSSAVTVWDLIQNDADVGAGFKPGYDGALVCQICVKSHPASSRCLECNQDMCEAMSEAHVRMASSKNHTMIAGLAPAPTLFCARSNCPGCIRGSDVAVSRYLS